MVDMHSPGTTQDTQKKIIDVTRHTCPVDPQHMRLTCNENHDDKGVSSVMKLRQGRPATAAKQLC